MPDVAKLGIEVESRSVKQAAGDLGKLSNESQKAARSADKLGTETGKADTQTGKLSRSVGGMIAKYAGIGVAVAGMVKLTKASMGAAAAIETQETNFGVLLGNMRDGEKLFKQLQDFSAATPLAVENLSGAAQQLMSFGIEAGDVTDTLQMLGDASLGNAQKLQTLSRAYGRVQAKGKASMEEINMAMEQGLPIIAELAESMGVSEQAVFDLASQGKVSAEIFNEAFESMTSEGGQFNNGMETLSQTFNGKLSTAMDNIKIAGATMFDPALEGAGNVLEAITEVSQEYVRFLEMTRDPHGYMQGQIETFIGSNAELIEEADTFGDLEGQVRGLSEAMFDAAKETGNFDAAARQAREAANLEQDIRRVREEMEDTVGPIMDTRDAIASLFDRKLQTDSENWWENFTAEDRVNQVARLLDEININGDDLLNSSDAQSLAQAGEAAIVTWLDNQIDLLGGRREELEELTTQLEEIFSGEGITGSGDSGGGAANPMATARTGLYDKFNAELAKVGLLDDAGALSMEDRINRLISANENYAESLAGLGREALNLDGGLGMQELDDALTRLQQLQRMLDTMEGEASGPYGANTQANYLPSGSGRADGANDEADAVVSLAEALGWAAEEGDGLKQSLESIGQAIGDAGVNALSDGFIAVGEAFAAGESASGAFVSALSNVYRELMNQLPAMFLRAGLNILAEDHRDPRGWAFVAAAAGTGAYAGYLNYEASERQADGRAQGGSVHSGTPYIVGENGPELFMPSESGRVIPNGQMGGGKTNVIVNNYSGAQVQTRERNNNGTREIELTVGRLVEKQVAEGRLDGAMSSRYGVRRRGR